MVGMEIIYIPLILEMLFYYCLLQICIDVIG